MSYVPNCEVDVFVSYAQVDDRSPRSGEDGWVTLFCNSLKIELEKKVGRINGVEISFDKGFSGNPTLEAKIKRILRKTAVFVSILTPGYLASDWCLKEVSWFVQFVGHQLQIGTSSRFVKILHSEVSQTDLYAKLRCLPDSLSRRFFYHPIDASCACAYRRTAVEDKDQRYWEALGDVANDIYLVLFEMHQRAEMGADPLSPASVSAKSTTTQIFLADVTDDLLDARDGLRRELEAHGIEVLPRVDLGAVPSPELVNHLKAELKQAQVSVHLIGGFYGREALGAYESRSVPHLEFELAREAGHLRRIVSVPPEIDPNRCPPRQRDLIEAIETEADPKDKGPSTLPLTLLRKGIEELKSEILIQVREARMARELSGPRSNKGQFRGNSPLLCVLFHPVDEHGLGREIFEMLKGEALDVWCQVHPDPAKPLDSLERMPRAMATCDAFLIVHADAPLEWLNQVVLGARKQVLRRLKHPYLVKSILNGPPPHKPELAFSFRDWVFVDCRSGVVRSALDPFLDNMR